MTKTPLEDLEQRINYITRRVRKKKIGRLLRFHFPKKSDEYQMYKEEALREEVPAVIYEASVAFSLKSNQFILDVRSYLSGELERYSDDCKNFKLPDAKRDEEYYGEWGHNLYLANPLDSLFSEEWHRSRICYSRGMNGAIEKTIKIEKEIDELQRKIKHFDNLFGTFPAYRDTSKIVEEEQVRVQVLDRIKGFTLDYEKVILPYSLIATDNDFGNVASGIVDRLVKVGYAPAVNYRKRLDK